MLAQPIRCIVPSIGQTDTEPLVLASGIVSIVHRFFFSVIGEPVRGGKVRIINYDLIRKQMDSLHTQLGEISSVQRS